MAPNENEEEQGQTEQNPNEHHHHHHTFLGMQRPALVRLVVCVVTLWLILLLLTLLVVVGMYTSQANQILVVSSVAVISMALIVASCKLNSLTGLSKMVAKDVAAKADPPPTYDDVLHSEAPPPPYFAVVSEASGSGISGSSSIRVIVTNDKEGTNGRPEDNQSSKRISSPGNRGNATFKRWVGRPGILQSVKFRASRRPTTITASSQPVKGRGLGLRRSSSTPSLADLTVPPSFPRCPSTPSLCDPCGCF